MLKTININNWSLLWLSIIFLTGCQSVTQEAPLFERVLAAETGIHFKNEVVEDDTHNILNFTNMYTGSGVGIGDFNKDGLPDIFLGGCMESSRLYLNEGDFKFTDITEKAGVETNRWITGVAVVDINADGWEDLYLSVSGSAKGVEKANLLFINNGFSERKNGEISFSESAETFGLADTAQCTHGNFFDYDKDGDLDLFLIVNPTDYALNRVNNIRRKKVNGEANSTDKLYQNNGNGTFSDISQKAGILIEGYSLGVNISDLNNDGWQDIYITNDFLSNDVLYVNNQDGTFTNRASEMLKHTSFASMGLDIADLNNDGFPEIYVLDMFPEDNYRKKMIMGNDNYDRFQYMLKMGYEPQYSRNTLQLNNGDGTFSEVGQLANVHKTDWSWSTLLSDFDNDGLRDIYLTNGFKRDLGSLDYINYANANTFGSPAARRKKQLASIKEQPGAKLPNYIFKNIDGINFQKKSQEWGIAEPSFSHGAAYADLDLDGDLDLVVNNVSQETFIYRNNSNQLNENHFIKIKLIGEPSDNFSMGTKITIYAGTLRLYAEQNPFRGYESSVDPVLHFGLGKAKVIDSIKVYFIDGEEVVLENILADTTIVIDKKIATLKDSIIRTDKKEEKRYFKKNNTALGLAYKHEEDIQVDFKQQILLPHQHSQLGPAMAKGDINGDGLEDVFIGGAAGKSATFFIQTNEQQFVKKEWFVDEQYEDTNALFFDADGDQDLDLYVTSGGVIFTQEKEIYQDRLYLNDGKGNFEQDKTRLPQMRTSTKTIEAIDFDKDGDIDLFIGGRVSPNNYPKTPKSYILENENGVFKDVTNQKAAGLQEIGMVTDAKWTDIDKDGDVDLIMVGEWMPFTVFANEDGFFSKVENTSLENTSGWWNTLEAGDFDKDGDVDFLAGNLGLNTNLKASEKEPVCLYVNDFDKNGQLDPIMCQYIEGIEYAIPSRDKLIAQIPPIKVRFNTYHKYASASFDKVFKGRELKDIQVFESKIFESCYIENKGNGEFEVRGLPIEIQMAPINKFMVKDFDKDDILDAIAIGNDYDTAVMLGRYDAFTGAFLKGKGDGTFKVTRGTESGFLSTKNAQNMIAVTLGNKIEDLIIIGNNQDSLEFFSTIK